MAKLSNGANKSVIETMEELKSTNGWNKIRSFGEGSALDTYQKLIDLAWDKLDENERAKFLIRIDEENKAKEETK